MELVSRASEAQNLSDPWAPLSPDATTTYTQRRTNISSPKYTVVAQLGLRPSQLTVMPMRPNA